MKFDDRETKIKKLEEQRNKAIKSLTDYKESNLPVSAAAEYLTFVAGSGESSVEVRYQDENIWLTQKMMAELYGVDRSVITKHLKKVFLDDELEEDSVCAIFAHTDSDEKTYKVKFYALQAVIAVGFKIDNQRAVQFRKWIITIAKDYTIKGFVMDDERFKLGHKLTNQYFEEQLVRIREIRESERMFYQKVTDIYSTAIDYDKSSKTTKEFFKKVQNKLHYAVHRHTAAEIITERADADRKNMGLTTWKSEPEGKIQKFDVSIAKNYLTEKEIDFLNRLVSMYLDYAEVQAENNIPMTMEDWSNRLDGFIEFNGRDLLMDAGKISAEQAKLYAETQFEKYGIVQDQLFKSDFDLFLESYDE
ncbi:virulence RhuM family protein [Sedimentibacter sp.]|uniref:virulence RhuM family protein n=1 Tax=Sedimentibacter sp. TaxID=1960295 RepID=UPI0028B147AC|nr:virulence RhuM family protein [Sedimentibacter sp.]